MSMHVPATASRLVAALLAALLVLVLAMAGAGRGLAAASDGPAFDVAGGDRTGSIAAAPICHARGTLPAPVPQRHDCCDACALCAPAVLPLASALPASSRPVHAAARVVVAGPTLVPARPRLPGLARGPPSA